VAKRRRSNPIVPRRVSVADVAREAGVSTCTVSKVLQGKGYASPPREVTRQKVLAAARKLGYRPNVIAQSLQARRSLAVALMVPYLGSPFVAAVIAGAEQACQEADYAYILRSAQNDIARVGVCIELFERQYVDGVLLLWPYVWPYGKGARGALESLQRHRIPLVIIGRSASDTSIPCFQVDNLAGARLVIEHLIGWGHRRIAFIAARQFRGEEDARLSGYRQALREAGITVDEDLIAAGGFQAECGAQAMRELLLRAEPPTAVFCYNDVLAFGALKALHQDGIGVPEHVSVVGFDNVEFCEYSLPPLTSVSAPGFQMGYQAARRLIALIEGSDGPRQGPVVFTPELIVRESSGPVRNTGSAS